MFRLYGLRLQLVLWTILLEAILMGFFGVTLVSILQNTRNKQIDETLRLSASQLNAVVDVSQGQYQISASDRATLRAQGVSAWVLNPQGDLVVTIGTAEDAALPALLPATNQFINTDLPSGEPIRLLVSPLLEGSKQQGALVLILSLRDSQATIRQIWLSLGIAVPVVLFLSGVGGLFLANRALSPVARITQTAKQISAQDLSRRLELDLPNDEIGQLARTFDAMLERLDYAFQRERQLTADVSHELRTPLGMLKTQLSLARSRPRDAVALLEMMADMEGDVDRITRLAEQMLTLARVEQAGSIAVYPLDLGEILQEVVSSWLPKTHELGVQLSFNHLPHGDLDMEGDSDSLRQIFANLVDNALKYTSQGGSISITANRQGPEIEVRVSDTGIGIAPEHLPHLFERFYRADSARSRTTGGVGLGLAITQAMVQVHQGKIRVESQSDHGTTFSVTLPVCR